MSKKIVILIVALGILCLAITAVSRAANAAPVAMTPEFPALYWSMYGCNYPQYPYHYAQISWVDPPAEILPIRGGKLLVVEEPGVLTQEITWTFLGEGYGVYSWGAYYVHPQKKYWLDAYLIGANGGTMGPDKYYPPCSPNITNIYLPLIMR